MYVRVRACVRSQHSDKQESKQPEGVDRVQVPERRRVRRGTEPTDSEVREHSLGLEVVDGSISSLHQHLLPPYGGRGRGLNLPPDMRTRECMQQTQGRERSSSFDWTAWSRLHRRWLILFSTLFLTAFRRQKLNTRARNVFNDVCMDV